MITMKTTVIAIALIAITVTTSKAKADILFLDMNFATSEVPAAKAAAQARGEKLWVFPERSDEQQSEMDAQWRLTQDLQMKWNHCLETSGSCAELEQKYQTEKKKMDALVAEIKQMNGAQLAEILSKLRQKQVRLTSIIFSGHSGGGTIFGGLFGSITDKDIRAAFQAEPTMSQGIKSVLLWGCYSGTLNSLHNVWKKMFPEVSLFVGYQLRSPLGIRESSGRFLKSTLLTESALLKASSLEEAHQIFKTIDLVADLDGTAEMGDYFLSYDEAASITTMLARCSNMPEDLLNKYRCYNNGEPGCENPPPNHLGPLRDFYSFLQLNRHCSEILHEKYPDLPTPDHLVRLIYLDTIKENLANHHRQDFANYATYLKDAGMDEDLGMDRYIHSKRSEDMQRFWKTEGTMVQRGLNDGSIGYDEKFRELFRVEFANSGFQSALVAPMESLLISFTMTEECTPFAWVDPDSPEPDKCKIGLSLDEPMSSTLEEVFLSLKYGFQMNYLALQLDPGFWGVVSPYSEIPSIPTLEGQKQAYVSSIESSLKRLEWHGYKSPASDPIISMGRSLIAAAQGWTDRQVVEKLLAEFPFAFSHLEYALSQVKDLPHNGMIVKTLEASRETLVKKKEFFEGLIR